MSLRMNSAVLVLLVVALLALLSCSEETDADPPGWDPGLQRMVEQPRYDHNDAHPLLPGGTARQPAPAGSVPRERDLAQRVWQRYRDAEGDLLRSPPRPIDGVQLVQGHQGYERWCASCHGLDGRANTFVASRMPLVPPRDLHNAELRGEPIGHLFQVISEGYGYMAGFANEISARDRWAIAAYVETLQLSQRFPAAALSAEEQRQLQKLDTQGAP